MFLLSPAALAAPARHHKRGHQPSSSKPDTKQDTTPDRPADVSPSGERPDTLPPDSAGPPAEAPPAPDGEGAPAPVAAVSARPATPPVAVEASSDNTPVRSARPPRAAEPSDVELVLGRLEAQRLADGRSEVAVMASLDVGRRDFTYSDPIGAPPQAYHLAAVPLATVGMDVYPFASTGIPGLQDVGVRGRFSRAFAVGSSTTQGAHLDTRWTRFGGELRQRFLFRTPRFKELGVAAGVDADDFDLQTDHDVGALVPSARTVCLRFGADGRVFLTDRVSVLFGAGYLVALSRGQIYDRFRAPKVAGVDGDATVSLRLTTALELRLAGRYTRYFASFAPQVGDALVAGGALDQQFQVGLGVRHAH